MSHSKRNTSRAVFTSYERSQAKAAWGASSARLSRESFLPFASCSLCLEAAVEPVACPRGDIFCRECALSNILAQKKEIRRAARARADAERDEARARDLGEQEAHDRAVREFELVQAGFDVSAPPPPTNHGKEGDGKSAAAAAAEAATAQAPPPKMLLLTDGGGADSSGGSAAAAAAAASSSSSSSSKKRAFELDEEEVARIAAEDRAKARRTIDSEKAAKPTLPSFWAPTVTPTSNQHNVLHEVKKPVKREPVCPSSKEGSPHPLSMHSLTAIHFTEDGPPEGAKGGSSSSGAAAAARQRICPSCRKALSNSSKAVLAKPCGHVVCKSCVAQFMTPTGRIDPHAPEADPNEVRCFVCDADVTERGPSDKHKKDKTAPGLVELRSEGTGFSAGGVNQVKKLGVAFQC
ncbi:hypothetical protein RB600_007182 [Gaeumannomyces tritici]